MKKSLNLLLIMILYSQVFLGQDNFSRGIEAAQQSKFVIADSLFHEYLKENPHDVNARFNIANIKLQLKDTCTFCNLMQNISVDYKDKDAMKLFSSICGKTDTLFYNKKFELTTEKKPRYSIISIPNFCDKSFNVNIHDNSKKNISVVSTPDIISSYKTNVIASYRLKSDGSKIYLFVLDSEPIFPGGKDKRELYTELSADIQQAKKELSLYHIVVNVVYTIDKTGQIKDFEIDYIKGVLKDNETKEKLKTYVSSYFMNMPSHIPAKFRNENVDYRKRDMIVFW